MLLSITTSSIGSCGNWTLSFPVWNRGFAGPPRPTVWPLPNTSMSPGVSTCKYRLFSQHLINVSGGLLMCKWVKALLPLCRHNVCAEAQSCLRSRDSQISRCGAKPVALSTREPLRVFNSLSLSLSLFPRLSPIFQYVQMKPMRAYVRALDSITCPCLLNCTILQ